MCNLNKIGWLIAGACAGVLAAIVFCAIAAVAAGTFYGALANGVLMISAAVAIGLALVSINIAIQSVGPCTINPCKAPGTALQNSFIAVAIALTVLLAALILGIFAASIPWAGVAVAIGLGVGAAALAIALTVAQRNLTALELCMAAPRAVGVNVATGFIATTVAILVIALVTVTGGVFLGGW